MSPTRKFWLRAALVAAVTLFVATALIVPQWNSSLSGVLLSPRSQAWLANGWVELQAARMSVDVYVSDRNEWPTRLDALEVPVLGDVFELSLQPNEVVGTVRPLPQLDRSLHGRRVLYRWDPLTRDWSCRAGDPPLPPDYLPLNCRSEEDFSGATTRSLTALLVLSLLVLLVLGVLLLWRHPLIAPIQRDPARLKRMPLPLLRRIDTTLGWLQRRDATLAAAGVDPADWNEALGFAQLVEAQRAQRFALRALRSAHRAAAGIFLEMYINGLSAATCRCRWNVVWRGCRALTLTARSSCVEVEMLRRSFARLQLAYVLEKHGERFSFAVPLFARQFEAAEIPLLLAEELRQLA